MSETNEFLFSGVSTHPELDQQSNDQSVYQIECFIDLQDQKSKHLLETVLEIQESFNQSNNQSKRINVHIVPMVSPENRQSFYLLKAAVIAGLYQPNKAIKQSNEQTDFKSNDDGEEKSNKLSGSQSFDQSTIRAMKQSLTDRINQSINQTINQSKVVSFLRYFYPQSDRFNSSTHYVNKTEEDLINHCCRLLIDFFDVDEDEFDCFYGLVKSYENHLSNSPSNEQSNNQSNNQSNQSTNAAQLIEQMAVSVCRYAMKRGIYQSPTLIVNGQTINQSINQSNNADALKAEIQKHLAA